MFEDDEQEAIANFPEIMFPAFIQETMNELDVSYYIGDYV